MIGVAAWYLRHGRFVDEAKVMIVMGVVLASVLVPAQIVVGDLHGVNTLEHQPQKLAAIEGLWDSGNGVPAVLIAWPDETSQSNRFEFAIPKLASLYLTHSWNGHVKGLKDFAPRPAAAGRAGVLRVPADGRDVGDHAAVDRLRLVAGVAAAPVRHTVVPARGDLGDPGRLHRGHRRLDHDRGRPPALGRLRAAAHRRFGDAEPQGSDVLVSLLGFIVVYIIIFGAGLYYFFKLVRAGRRRSRAPPEPGDAAAGAAAVGAADAGLRGTRWPSTWSRSGR